MKKTFRLSLTWLHTWSGLLLGWVLYAIFITGTATYFRHEITQWMQPELPRHAGATDVAQLALRRLQELAPNSPRWGVELPDDRSRALMISWQDGPGRRDFKQQSVSLEPGPMAAVRESRGGEFFYRFHFQLQLPHPWGRYLAGVAAMCMFVALISGIVTHRQFFKDFFTFRPGRVSLRTTLDFHNVTAVLALPFYLMISYSALVIFMHMYMPWAERVLPPEPEAAVQQNPGITSGSSLSLVDLERMLQKVDARWAGGPGLKRIDFSGRNTDQAVVRFTRVEERKVSSPRHVQLQFNGVTGEMVEETTPPGGVVTAVHSTLYGLHLARFAGPGLRWAFFCMGLMGAALVATGLVVWTIKRRLKSRGSFGLWLVERLNVATITGLLIAIGVLFWANRLLPVTLADRGDWEVSCFLYAWALALLHAVLRRVMQAWQEQLLCTAFLFIALPALDALTAGAYLQKAWQTRHTAHLVFDAAVFVLGTLVGSAAWRLTRRPKSQTVSQAPVAVSSPVV